MRKERDGFEWGWSREVHVAGSVEGARDNGMKDRDDTHYSVKRSNDKRSNDGRDEHDPDASWFEPPTPGLKSAQGDTESTPYSQAKSPSVPAPTLYSYSTPDLNFTSPSPPPSNFTSNRPSSIASIDTITTRYSTPSTLPPASVDTHTATDNNHHDSLSLSHKLTGAFEAGLSTGPPSFVSSEPSIRSHSHFHFPSRAATLDVPVPAHLDPRSRPKRTSSIPPSPLPVPAAPFRPSHVHTHSGSGSGYSFMPPGLYDPRAFEAIYEREREGGEV
ncbi:hypothetical protein K439DRAFT_74323 [Ramaria rubella]|nr:hypothetical protein K439DRAFT_74323 [Ramaria rubella]